MKELKEDVKVLMKEEYRRAAEEFGERNNSPHESYAVLKEEVEEAKEELRDIKEYFTWYWHCVKKNNAEQQEEVLKRIEEAALNAACECIQVAAMAYKARK